MNFLGQWIKLVFLNIWGLFRKALCCFSRRRKNSYRSESPIQITDVVVVSVGEGDDVGGFSRQQQQNQYNYGRKQNVERDWNSWDDSPQTVEEHIQQYRERFVQPPTPQNDAEPEPDFFKELTPVIKPQPKYYLNNDKEKLEPSNFSRLEAKIDVPITMNAELEDWNDDELNDGGWEELDSEEARQVIREKRREMRQQRQKQQQQQKGANNNYYNNGIATNNSNIHGIAGNNHHSRTQNT